MKRPASKSRRSSPAWSVALLLAFAVSVWGLHYKLSLYHPSTVNAHGPAAKLLSQKERPVASIQMEATGQPDAQTEHPTVAHSLAVLALSATPVEFRRLYVDSHEAAHRAVLIRARPSSPRPPPITA